MDRQKSLSLAANLPLIYALFARPYLIGAPLLILALTRILPLLDIKREDVDWEEAQRKARLGAILACTFYSISPFCTPLCLLALRVSFLDKKPFLILFACDSPLDLFLSLVWARCAALKKRNQVDSLLHTSTQDAILFFILGTHGLPFLSRLILSFITLGACALAWKDKLPTIRSMAEGIYVL